MLPVDFKIDSSTGVTLLSNAFIDHYMKDANEVQIKVYLYLLRSVSAGKTVDLNMLADDLNYPEREITRALRYWSNQGILSFRQDAALRVSGNDYYEGRISGIYLQNPQPVPFTAVSPRSTNPFPEELSSAHLAFNSVPQQQAKQPAAPMLPDPDSRKAGYTLNDLRQFKAQPENACLLIAAQQYLGKPLSEVQFRSLLFLSEGLSFSPELTDYLLQYCIGNGQKSFHYIEATDLAWAEQGITTVEEAKTVTQPKPDPESSYIMNLLGRSGTPAPQESRLIHRWLHKYAFSMEMIEEACSRTVMAVENHRFTYAEKILKSWHEKGLHTLDEVNAADEAYHQAAYPKTESGSAARSRKSGFCNLESQQYDFLEIENKLVDN